MLKYIEVALDYNQQLLIIQSNLKEIFKEIKKKYTNKSGKNDIYLIYNGNKINEEKTVEEVINSEDKNSSKMRILVNDIEGIKIDERIVNAQDIICPKCKESIKIKIENYKISLYGCKNEHKTVNILFDEFENTQKINESEIKCGNCNNNKSNVYNNEFYKCHQCGINICPICKSIHDKTHNIINYDKKNYICEIHNEKYISFCKNCKKNICVECELMHNNHKLIYFGKIIANKDEIEKRKSELRGIINKIKEDVEDIIKKLEKVIENMEEYMNINMKIINNIEEKNRNYEILSNINEIMNNNEIIKDIQNIINEKDINDKFKYIINIYNKMYKKEENNNYNKNKKENNNNNDIKVISELFLQIRKLLT